MARRSTTSALQAASSQKEDSEIETDESQRVSALSSLLQTPKTNYKELQSFDARVAEDRQELKALLQQRTQMAEETSMRRRNELMKVILSALQAPNRPVPGTAPTLGETKIARNAAFRSVARILRASEHLVGEYDRLDKMITGLREAEPEGIAEAWVEDVEKTARLLRVGAEAALKNVKKVLGAEVEADDAEDTGREDEKMGAVERMEINYELKKSLQAAERGVKKMVQGLPQDE